MRNTNGQFSRGATPFNPKIDRTGETRLMNNGLKAKIIHYQDSLHIDIEFENGQIVEDRTYRWFKLGKIRCPNIVEYYDGYAKITNVNIVPNFSFLVDIEDVDKVKNVLWHDNKSGGDAPYAFNNKLGFLHRYIMSAPSGMDIDHRGQDTLDNRKSNLRACTNYDNNLNKPARMNNKSGYKGVCWHRASNKWMVQLNYNGKRVHYSLHEDIKDAARAYNSAALKYHGEFAKLNILD